MCSETEFCWDDVPYHFKDLHYYVTAIVDDSNAGDKMGELLANLPVADRYIHV